MRPLLAGAQGCDASRRMLSITHILTLTSVDTSIVFRLASISIMRLAAGGIRTATSLPTRMTFLLNFLDELRRERASGQVTALSGPHALAADSQAFGPTPVATPPKAHQPMISFRPSTARARSSSATLASRRPMRSVLSVRI